MAPQARQAGLAGGEPDCGLQSGADGGRRAREMTLDGGAGCGEGEGETVRILDMRKGASLMLNDIGNARFKLTKSNRDKPLRANVAGFTAQEQKQSPSTASSSSTCSGSSTTSASCKLVPNVGRQKCTTSLLVDTNELTATSQDQHQHPKQTLFGANHDLGSVLLQSPVGIATNLEGKLPESAIQPLSLESSIENDAQSRQLRRKKRRNRNRKQHWPATLSLHQERKQDNDIAGGDGYVDGPFAQPTIAPTLIDREQSNEDGNDDRDDDNKRENCRSPPTIGRATLAGRIQRREVATSDYYSTNSTPSHATTSQKLQDREKKVSTCRTVIYDNPAFVACKSSKTATVKIFDSRPLGNELIYSAATSQASALNQQAYTNYNSAALERRRLESSFRGGPEESPRKEQERMGKKITNQVEPNGANSGVERAAEDELSGSTISRNKSGDVENEHSLHFRR